MEGTSAAQTHRRVTQYGAGRTLLWLVQLNYELQQVALCLRRLGTLQSSAEYVVFP